MSGLYARPSDIITTSATSWAWQAGTPDATYPIANMDDGQAETVAKVTGGSGTLRGTYSSSKTLQGVVIANTNATAISIQNGAGLNVAMTIPSVPLDGQPLDPWIDLRGLASTSSTQWDIVLTGPGPTSVGEVLLVQTWRVAPLLWGLRLRERHGTELLVTDYGTRNKWRKGARQRTVESNVIDGAYDTELDALIRDCYGMVRNFVLVLNPLVADAMYVDLTVEEFEMTRQESNVSPRILTFSEQQKGLA